MNKMMMHRKYTMYKNQYIQIDHFSQPLLLLEYLMFYNILDLAYSGKFLPDVLVTVKCKYLRWIDAQKNRTPNS